MRGGLPSLVPLRGAADEFAVGRHVDDFDDGDFGEVAGAEQLLAAAAFDVALVHQVAQHALQRDLVGALQIEVARKIAFGGFGMFADVGQYVGARRC